LQQIVGHITVLRM